MPVFFEMLRKTKDDPNMREIFQTANCFLRPVFLAEYNGSKQIFGSSALARKTEFVRKVCKNIGNRLDLQEIFHKEYKYCIDARNAKHADDRTRTNIARAFDTSIVVYGTEESDLFVWEPLFENITLASEKEIRQMTEDEFETILNRTDPKAAIKQTTRLQKVRDLDTSIGDSLKRVYDYRCQMTGEIVGERYGVHTVEAHHILPFTESLNNDTSNIMILSPNYHRLIHKAKPTFNRKTLSFEFPNGLIETVKLNLHLK